MFFFLFISSHNTRTTQWEDPRIKLNAQRMLTQHQSAESLLVRSQQQLRQEVNKYTATYGPQKWRERAENSFFLFSIFLLFSWRHCTKLAMTAHNELIVCTSVIYYTFLTTFCFVYFTLAAAATTSATTATTSATTASTTSRCRPTTADSNSKR